MNRRLVIVSLCAYLVALGVVGLGAKAVDAPYDAAVTTGIDWARGAGLEDLRYGHVEALANLAFFLPLGALLALLLPRRGWWLAAVVGFGLSLAIEAAQLLLLSARTPHLRDVLFNTAGATIGALAVRLLGRASHTGPVPLPAGGGR